ncbi:MAG: UDP-galactopyranose mutase [Candidatus Izemoplasma sp.]|nr:UDP-galactopyranose mutase [Candidatus Izemoplasma sp.]
MTNKQKYDFLIVGSGLFGAVFAHEASKQGYTCKVIEKRDHLAGNIYTKSIDGINIHQYGPHIFHTNDEKIWKYVTDKVSMHPFINQPLARYQDQIYSLPFSMRTFYELFNTKTPEEAKKKIEEETMPYIKEKYLNLEEKALSLVGKTIYERLIKGYTEKQWGRKATELPTKIIERLPLRFTYNSNYFNDLYQGIPVNGYTELIEKLLENIEVSLNIDFLDEKDKYEKMAKNIIYTGKIDDYFNQKFGALDYRSLRFETEWLDTDNFQGNAVVNYTEKEVPFTRIVEHKFFGEDHSQPKTVITKEYPLDYQSGMEAYYPINDDNNNKIYNKYKDLANRENNVFFGGRLGLYKYFDMDDTIIEALKLADRLLSKEVII